MSYTTRKELLSRSLLREGIYNLQSVTSPESFTYLLGYVGRGQTLVHSGGGRLEGNHTAGDENLKGVN